MTNINECPLVEWFKFKEKCEIRTCKFHTNVLTSGCIAIERVDTNGKKLLTDRELCYYKFDADTSISDVTLHRKKILIRVKRIIALLYYAEHIVNCGCVEYEIPQNVHILCKKAPFKLKKLHITPTVLCNMLNEKNFESYKKKVKLDDDLSLCNILFMSQKDFESLYIEVQKMNSVKY